MLRETTNAAWAGFVDAAMAAFERLEEVDPDMVQAATEAYGSSRTAAIAFARPGGTDHRSAYADLAAGRRDEVRSRMMQILYGMY